MYSILFTILLIKVINSYKYFWWQSQKQLSSAYVHEFFWQKNLDERRKQSASVSTEDLSQSVATTKGTKPSLSLENWLVIRPSTLITLIGEGQTIPGQNTCLKTAENLTLDTLRYKVNFHIKLDSEAVNTEAYMMRNLHNNTPLQDVELQGCAILFRLNLILRTLASSWVNKEGFTRLSRFGLIAQNTSFRWVVYGS